MKSLILALWVGAVPPVSALSESSSVAIETASSSTASTAVGADIIQPELSPEAAPSPDFAVELAAPKATPVTIERTDFWDQLRFSGLVLSTVRWQIDNGDRTQPFITDEFGNLRENQSWDVTGEDFGDLVTTVGGSVGYKNYLLAARFDTAVYFHKPVAAESANNLNKNSLQDRYVNLFRAEYLAGSYTGKNIEVTLGDSYVTLGRGMILSLRKVGDVGVDNKLRGAKLSWRHGGWRVLLARGWVNGKNFETGTGYYYPERLDRTNPDGRFYEANDVVTAARIGYRLSKYLEVAAHAALVGTPKDERGFRSDVLGSGVSVELPRPLKWLSAYLEFAHLRRDDTRLNPKGEFRLGGTSKGLFSGDIETGFGLYGSTSLYFGPLTVLVEGKYYDNMFNIFARGIRQPERGAVNRYAEPPTAERPLSILLANNSVIGGRTRFDYRVAPGIVPYVSFGLYRDDSFGKGTLGQDLDGAVPTNVWAIFGGGRFNIGHTHLTAETGYRTQTNDYSSLGPSTLEAAVDREAQDRLRADLDGSPFRNDLHLLVDLVQPIWGSLSTEFVINGLYAVQGIGNQTCAGLGELPEECGGRADGQSIIINDEWFEGRTALSLKSSDGWAVTGAYEFYTRQPDKFDSHYFSVAGQYEFAPGSIVRAMYGGERAGLKCSGGVCRFFPGFEGGRLELVVRL